ncbi:J domain-containing protein [Microcoleus sp. LEGE 07076]|uniref:DnaJ domain-containing protein n=1 Tax=Microcoleus sp. LEGE 07076 TaxID=915322 RepID=UPI00187E1502|nr:J domain-containing protein [Microcoleus sp. LEGE 07076]
MSSVTNHYTTLKISPTATQAEIKQAYRRLVKIFHPDSHSKTAGHEEIVRLNAAYEILGDAQQRQSYDRQISQSSQQQSPYAPNVSRQRQQTARDADEQMEQWLIKVYKPVNRMLNSILKPLKKEINELSADPFDDELIEKFQAYIETSSEFLEKAHNFLRSMPNPSNVAGVAAHLYYCINQVGDGIEELHLFTLNYDDRHLHTGQELFRIASRLRREAQEELKIRT